MSSSTPWYPTCFRNFEAKSTWDRPRMLRVGEEKHDRVGPDAWETLFETSDKCVVDDQLLRESMAFVVGTAGLRRFVICAFWQPCIIRSSLEVPEWTKQMTDSVVDSERVPRCAFGCGCVVRLRFSLHRNPPRFGWSRFVWLHQHATL